MKSQRLTVLVYHPLHQRLMLPQLGFQLVPQQLTATAGNGNVTLNWEAPISDGGSFSQL